MSIENIWFSKIMPPKLTVFRVRWNGATDTKGSRLRLTNLDEKENYTIHNNGDDLDLRSAVKKLQDAGYKSTGQFEYKGDWFLTVEK